ncbi:hypothetical protein [Hymenobacter coccineus]|uniref:Auto-transporter adhesin head GIN domain-containing protein n=1 Tax=Hymenobacter coccineus TaxID=1908235 RepID=A0A1G1SYH0_9BACT|nr:hypothetical protein [Hymenobacter coccineus]OGX83650.1 hypothetical protein BEN49_12305 [Hymenobacter coccineus]
MKNSNKWVLAAAVLLLASLTAFNMGLQAEYRTGNYKDPLHNFTALDFKNFTSVSVPGATALQVKIVRGPFGVRLNKDVASEVHVAQQGGQLVVTAHFKGQRQYWGQRETLLITCPRLDSLTTDAVYELDGKPQTDKNGTLGRVVVENFAQDSLVLRQHRTSRVFLAGNTLRYLRAEVGSGPGGAALDLNGSNHIAAADLDVRRRGELSISNVVIPQLRYHFADSAKATLAGTALGQLVR